MPSKWNKKLQSELDTVFAEGLCNTSTTVGDAYDMSEAFKNVTKETFKRYFYKKRNAARDESAAAGGQKIPESKWQMCLLVHKMNVHYYMYRI